MTTTLPMPSQSDPAEALTEDLLARFNLTAVQTAAAGERTREVAVTAGAGSGKTRTLVARYLPLLVRCSSPRRIVAITFTEKAAKEMRNRIRGEVRKLIEEAGGVEAGGESSRQRWIDLEGRLDSARISTIHSLCQEVLRAHPVEAGLDPQFGVVDENQAALLRAEAVRSALTAAVGDLSFQPLFRQWKAGTLEKVLNGLVNQRLEVDSLLQTGCDPDRAARRALERWIQAQPFTNALDDLLRWKADGSLAKAAGGGDNLAAMALELAGCLEQAQAGLAAGDMAASAVALFDARRQRMKGTIGKAGPLKALVKELRESYDAELAWLGGGASSDTPPAPEVERQVGQCCALLTELYVRARDAYLAALRRRSAVDFNDLEGKAHALLQRSEIAARWQSEVDWVLVDEFQDTNARQREIVRALCGNSSAIENGAISSKGNKLFVVGDARQSIYRFRGADVTVFKDLQAEIQAAGGLLIDLNCTFRTHAGLLAALGDFLEPVMNRADLLNRPYHVPYSALMAEHADSRENISAPHIEFVLAPGRDSAHGRTAAARALAQRLLALKAGGQIRRWSEVALLFRASTSFPVYEDAFEEFSIPYATVAGQGFYDRPEIRDVLNLLRALADPWDDLALAGLLCSPAFGLRQSGLVRLRWPGEQKTALYPSLLGDLSGLQEADREAAERARAFLRELLPWVDRIPVAELLQRAVAWTDYRAILAAGSQRLWRNLDKLLADAQASGMVQVRGFFEYLNTLKDVGAREGESAVDAAASGAADDAAGIDTQGAVRLMTIHKSKGLEFEFVVLADAARGAPNQSANYLLLPDTGWAFKPDRVDGEPLAYRYVKAQDRFQAEAETCRLLYVALTRAKEKVLISGHFTAKDEKISTAGWLKELLSQTGFDLGSIQPGAENPQQITLPCGQPVSIWANTSGEQAPIPQSPRPAPAIENGARPLFPALLQESELLAEEEGPDVPIWRATGQEGQVLGQAIGRMVHKAIQRWRFPGSPGLATLLDTAARESGVVEETQRQYALQEAERLLARFHAHPLWGLIDRATERLHEVPYTLLREDGAAEVGYIDLLYRPDTDSPRWSIVDFKTDTIQSEADLNLLVQRYIRQAHRYRRAVRALLGPVDVVQFCFLDACGEVAVKEVE